MECFIKKIWDGKGEEAHSYFVRFSKGSFENRAILNLQKTSKIKLKGSFEWANDFIKIISEILDINFSGLILSKEQLNLDNEKKKSGIFQYEVSDISSEKIKEIGEVYATLLDAETPDIKLKIKKKLPKPGKSEGKIDDKFCQIELDLRYWQEIKNAFMLPECKKCRISHTFIIEEIILPEDEKDFAKIREKAKRKGKIIRKLEIDKKESKEEKNFEA
ncbi:unnamed protein product [marine sediment metagenome]|uniref:Uncharacterized protein n=1 Tax=marine sediment metagenome TaxID=412755 RepID=X0WLI6_9ZZZZ